MNILTFLKAISMLSLIFVIGLISSCSSDDSDEMMDDSEEQNEISLSFTLDGTAQEAVFESGSIFLAINTGSISVISASGNLASNVPYAFAISFDSNTTGTYTLTQAAGTEEDDFSGLSLALIDGANSQSYSASSVTLTVTSYQVISLAQIIIEGTFSGTLVNDETQETSSITNGSFRTGFKD